ncbi:MAG: hypothetical protein EZS28_047362 [Streblomastix strix]|uniref:Uncharacterized protein n=1 Tax=Streblomastix strix TaxID=222440 RepID=A0A5J4THR6_9EUKA|nr:MAG: hypothetical protein EZS28_047362 [Streblomastix strix]
MDNIASFFSEIHGFRYSFDRRQIGHADIVPQIELIKTSEEQIEEEGGIEEIDTKLLKEESNGSRRIFQIIQVNVMQAILNISRVNNPNINNLAYAINYLIRRRQIMRNIINNNNPIIYNPFLNNNNNNINPNINNLDEDVIDLNGHIQFHGQRQRRLGRRDPRF